VNYLVDTNIVSEIRKGARADPNVAAWYDAVPEDSLYLSVLVLGEIRRGLGRGIERKRPRDAAQAAALEKWLAAVQGGFGERLLPVDGAVADAWGRVATWAKGVSANAVYFVAEAKRAHDDEPDEELEEDVLVLSGLSADGEEATFETPFERDDEGKVTVGQTDPSDTIAVPFNEFRELWGLPLIAGDEEPEH